ncbi:lebercilin-like protein isoform X1 [Plutella xylostella]|uniref:lebercilin-like protein isoform X1 n=2 Tax=Plutella xylostella TaxID=51655 RepID=UPI0020325EEA|nr:lebercilin-like protein isoform X1 [Plutella xylostella]
MAVNLKESLESLYSSGSRLSLLQKRKRVSPLSMDMSRSSSGKGVTQRLLSAKTHRVKALQNQLADAHYHLQELSNENRILKAVQKKHEIALQRYENSNAELPQVLNSHSEEMRVQQARYKQLKQQYREVSQRLKERDSQLQQLRDEHQHLLDLSKDRNLLEREKLQAQLADLALKVQQQNETISTLQRRLALEQKNFRHQLQNEINKHKDTRHDLDLAITNADKLSTIIEMKEKMLSSVSVARNARSPVKPPPPPLGTNRAVSKTTRAAYDERASGDQLSRLCENSRSLSSALSHDEETSSSAEPKSRYIRSRTNSSSTNTKSTPNQTRKNSKASDDMLEMAKTVQEGMAGLSLFEEEIDFHNTAHEDVQKKIESMKIDFMNKIKNNEDPLSRKASLKSGSEKDSMEEKIETNQDEEERPKSRGRRTSRVSLLNETKVEETVASHSSNYNRGNEMKLKRENSIVDRRNSKPIDKYCNNIMQDIEKSSQIIDRHVKEFNTTKFDGEKLVQQLHAVDKINEYVTANGDIPDEAFEELNNNFKMLTDQVMSETLPIAKKRTLSGRGTKTEGRGNLFGDSSMSNQDLLDDLLGKK